MNRFLHLRLRGAGRFLCRSTTDFPVADPAVGRGGGINMKPMHLLSAAVFTARNEVGAR